jgi:hypothetical protein
MKINQERISRPLVYLGLAFTIILLCVWIYAIYVIIDLLNRGNPLWFMIPVIAVAIFLPYIYINLALITIKGFKDLNLQQKTDSVFESQHIKNLMLLLSLEFYKCQIRDDGMGGAEVVGLDWNMNPHSLTDVEFTNLERILREEIDTLTEYKDENGLKKVKIVYKNGKEEIKEKPINKYPEVVESDLLINITR